MWKMIGATALITTGLAVYAWRAVPTTRLSIRIVMAAVLADALSRGRRRNAGCSPPSVAKRLLDELL